MRVFLITFFIVLSCSNRLFANLNMELKRGDSIYQEIIKKNKTNIDYLNLSSYFYSIDSLSLANLYSDSGIVISDNNDSVLARLYRIKAYTFLLWGTYNKSLEYFNKVMEIGNELNDKALISSGMHGKGRVFSEISNFGDAIKEFHKSIKIIDSTSLLKNKGILYNALGIAHQGLGNNDSAVYYFEKHLQLTKHSKDFLNGLYSMINIINVLIEIDSIGSVNRYLDSAISINKNLNSEYAKAAIYGNIAKLHLKKQDLDSSIYYLNLSNKISIKNKFTRFLITNNKLLYDSYLAQGNYKKALNFYKEYKELEDSIFNNEKIAKINALKYVYELEKKDASEKFLKIKYRNRTVLMVLSIISSLVLILAVFLQINLMKLKSKLHKKEKSKLISTIDLKNRELVSNLIETSKKSESIRKLKQTYTKLESGVEVKEAKQEIQKTLKELENNAKSEERWNKVKLHFEEVHPSFFKKIESLHPNLSTNDLKICAYTKMKLSTKEIANLLSISYRSVQTNRYRIKKKLELNKSEDLKNYINSI